MTIVIFYRICTRRNLEHIDAISLHERDWDKKKEREAFVSIFPSRLIALGMQA